MYFTEKCCSVCGAVNWDSLQGNYHNDHIIRGGRDDGKLKSCDTNGEVRKWDAHGNRVN
jgi:hypothetical protein